MPWDFLKISSPGGWRRGMITVSTSIISYHGDGMKAIPRHFSGNGYLDGYDVRVVMPRPIMQHILTKYYFIPSREYFPDHYEDEVEVWIRPGILQPGGVLARRQKIQIPNLLSHRLPAKQCP